MPALSFRWEGLTTGRVSYRFGGLLFLEFEAVFVFFEEFAEVFGHVEEADPLLVVERDREAAQAIDADAALFTDAKFQCPLFAAFGFFLEFGDARHQFFFCRFGHRFLQIWSESSSHTP